MQSKTLFLLGCIPVRIALAVLAYALPEPYLRYLAIPLFLIGLSFLFLYLTNQRLYAPEAGGVTWWRNWRPVHGMLYITAAVYAVTGRNIAALFLALDVTLGLAVFLTHHYLA